MRIDVRKYLFIGLEEQRETFFTRAQKAGLIHFIDSNPVPYKHAPEEVDRVLSAIKVVRSLPVVEQEELVDYDEGDGIVNHIVGLRETIEKREEQIRLLKMEIARVGVFGDFSKQEVEQIERDGHRKLQFFCGPRRVSARWDGEDSLILVGSEFGLDYFVGIDREPRQYEGLIEMKIERPLGELQQQMRQAMTELAQAEAALKRYSKYNHFLHQFLKIKLNHASLSTAEAYAQQPMPGMLFSIGGWVPEDKESDLHALLDDLSIHAEPVAIEENETAPTYLENTGAARIGEDLVHIYDTPSNTDNDPSLWVLFFFAIFFAVIVGDGGYGLVFLATALYLRTKFSSVKGLGNRLINLALILSVGCVLWGVMNASFFGVSLDAHNPLRKYSLLTWMAEKKAAYHFSHQDDTYNYWLKKYPAVATTQSAHEFLTHGKPTSNGGIDYEILTKLSDQVFIEFVLLLAVAHIMLSLVRYLPRNWPALGWLIFLVGAVLYIPPTFLDSVTVVQYVFGFDLKPAAAFGLQLITIGFALAVILAVIINKLLGLTEIMNVVQIFADVMSYLRLYALGLAGSIVAATVNEMAAVLPLVLGILLILVGHLLNMGLAIAGGLIHGLRLNFLEWYHYSFAGGGRLFRPLHLLEVEPLGKQDQKS